MLSNTEKIEIVNQHLRSVEYSLYNAQLDKVEANAVPDVDAALVADIDARIERLNLKKAALQSEKSSLEE